MKIEVGDERGLCVVTPGEDVTCDNHRDFSTTIERILDDGTIDLILDLTHVNYITSRGLGTVVGAYAVLKRRGGNLVLAGANEEVRKALSITRLDKVLTLVSSKLVALQTLKMGDAGKRKALPKTPTL